MTVTFFKAEEIVNKLRQAGVDLAQDQHGRGVVQAVGDHGRDVLLVAAAVRRDEGGPGEAPEGAPAGERSSIAAAGRRGT